jgi:DNA-binding transcriptional MerR regulator
MPETRQTQRPTLRGDGYDLPPIVEVETLRQAAPTAAAAASPKGEERLPIFWRIFGSTLLSIAALVAITLYQQINSSLNEIRSDLSHLNESQSDAVKKDEFNSRILALVNNLNDLKAATKVVGDCSEERSAMLDRRLRDSDGERKELARELQRLRERLAVVEGRQATPAAERSLR